MARMMGTPALPWDTGHLDYSVSYKPKPPVPRLSGRHRRAKSNGPKLRRMDENIRTNQVAAPNRRRAKSRTQGRTRTSISRPRSRRQSKARIAERKNTRHSKMRPKTKKKRQAKPTRKRRTATRKTAQQQYVKPETKNDDVHAPPQEEISESESQSASKVSADESLPPPPERLNLEGLSSSSDDGDGVDVHAALDENRNTSQPSNQADRKVEPSTLHEQKTTPQLRKRRRRPGNEPNQSKRTRHARSSKSQSRRQTMPSVTRRRAEEEEAKVVEEARTWRLKLCECTDSACRLGHTYAELEELALSCTVAGLPSPRVCSCEVDLCPKPHSIEDAKDAYARLKAEKLLLASYAASAHNIPWDEHTGQLLYPDSLHAWLSAVFPEIVNAPYVRNYYECFKMSGFVHADHLVALDNTDRLKVLRKLQCSQPHMQRLLQSGWHKLSKFTSKAFQQSIEYILGTPKMEKRGLS